MASCVLRGSGSGLPVDRKPRELVVPLNRQIRQPAKVPRIFTSSSISAAGTALAICLAPWRRRATRQSARPWHPASVRRVSRFSCRAANAAAPPGSALRGVSDVFGVVLVRRPWDIEGRGLLHVFKFSQQSLALASVRRLGVSFSALCKPASRHAVRRASRYLWRGV